MKSTNIQSGDNLYRVLKSCDKREIKVILHVRNAVIGQTIATYPATGADRYSLSVVAEIVRGWH